MTSPDRAFDGWLPGVVRRPSPHFNERPEGALVSLAVLHFISLPAGRFGGEDVDETSAPSGRSLKCGETPSSWGPLTP